MTADAWPATRWASLSAADVVALLSAPEVDGVVVARRVLMELRLRRAVADVRVRRAGLVASRQEVLAFVDGSGGAPASGLLADAWAAYRRLPVATFRDGTRGVEVQQVALELRTAHGGWVRLAAAAWAGLVARRLARLEQPSWSRRPRVHVLTPEGEVAAQELGDWVSTARERLAGWDGDADAAFAYTGRCGAATLAFDVLLRDIRTVVEDLRKAGLGAAFSEGFSA